MHDHIMKLDSIGMREVAEYAASERGKGGDPEYFVARLDPHTRHYRIRHVRHHTPTSTRHEVVIPASTPTVQPARPRVKDVAITVVVEGVDVSASLARYDAVFWSEAAVEKFLFPYYASKYQWAAARVLSVMSRHFYGYLPDLVNEPSVTLAGEEIPFAMGHLPRSDYVPIEEEAPAEAGVHHRAPGDDLVMLSLHRATGQVVHRPVSHLLRLEAETAPAAAGRG